MKRQIAAAGLAALTLFDIAGASAAEGGRHVVAPSVPVPVATWSGFFVGGQGGYRFGRAGGEGTLFDRTSGVSSASSTFRLGSGVGGPRLGYDLQLGPSWVVGLAGDFSWGSAGSASSRSTARSTGGVSINAQSSRGAAVRPAGFVALDGVTITSGTIVTQHEWDASLRVRAGYLVTPTLLGYATGGLALMDERVTASYAFNGVTADTLRVSKTRLGWTVGAGLEMMLDDHWRAHVEYRYTDFGSESYSWASVGAAGTLKTTANTVLSGVSYRF